MVGWKKSVVWFMWVLFVCVRSWCLVMLNCGVFMVRIIIMCFCVFCVRFCVSCLMKCVLRCRFCVVFCLVLIV